MKNHKEFYRPMTPNTVELLSFDIREQLPGWSFALDVPQITEKILHNNPILFYLESLNHILLQTWRASLTYRFWLNLQFR